MKKKYIIIFMIASMVMAILYFTNVFFFFFWAGCEIICAMMMWLFRQIFKPTASIIFALLYTVLSAFVWTQVPYTATFASQLLATIIYTFLVVFCICLLIGLIAEAVKMYQEIKNEPR